MWSAELNGKPQHFHLAGINNQNFLMRDEATGSWWQQSTGEAVLGPLRGRRLQPIAFDEVTFATWRAEHPNGRVLAPDPAVLADERYARSDWETRMAKTPVVTPSSPDEPFAPRDLVIGLEVVGATRAYAVADLLEHRVISDILGGVPVVLVMGDDARSVRAFEAHAAGQDLELYLEPDAKPMRLRDAQTGSEWDFTGLAVAGPLAGSRLVRMQAITSYWFDWKQQHRSTGAFLMGAPR